MGQGTILDFGSIEPWEIVPMEFNFADKYSCFTDDTPDTISSYAFGIYLASEDPGSPTLIPALVYKTDFLPAGKVKCWVGKTSELMTEGTYIIRVRVVTAMGSRYEEQGEFIVKEY